jgi:hypothetical protein
VTLEQFTNFRRDELIAFFRVRFGRSWRQVVARQTNMHPRSFQRWNGAPPTSLYRQIHKLERWARSIGFQASTDAEVQAAIQAHERFKAEAAEAIESAKSKRNLASSTEQDPDSHQMAAQIAEAMRRMAAGEVGRDAPPAKREAVL